MFAFLLDEGDALGAFVQNGIRTDLFLCSLVTTFWEGVGNNLLAVRGIHLEQLSLITLLLNCVPTLGEGEGHRLFAVRRIHLEQLSLIAFHRDFVPTFWKRERHRFSAVRRSQSVLLSLMAFHLHMLIDFISIITEMRPL